jgi:acyl-CoA thioester hydrolase
MLVLRSALCILRFAFCYDCAMPATNTSVFKVRYYECDLYGHVNNTNYLRYIQEAAFEASAAVGFGVDRYAGMQRSWHIHATDMEYLRPLKYGDTVEVKTWVADFRKVTSRRMYELRAQETGELVARAATDWAFIDTTTGKPAVIPQEFATAFFPEGVPSDPPAREKYPTAPPPPAGAYRMKKPVQWRELDSAGHVNNAIYAEWGEDCGMNCVAHFQWPATRMMQHNMGIFYRRMWLEYLQPALPNDEVEIVAWLSDLKRVSAMRHFAVHRVSDGALLCRINILAVIANTQTGMPMRIPQEMLNDFAPNIA